MDMMFVPRIFYVNIPRNLILFYPYNINYLTE